MVKLQTLKDLKNFEDDNGDYVNWDDDLRGYDLKEFIDDLRQEAIKWMKLSDYDLYELGFGKDDTSDDLRNWIKHFFNITEEDLK